MARSGHAFEDPYDFATSILLPYLPPMRYARFGDPAAAPRLARFLNLGTLADLPESSSAPRGDEAEVLAAVREAGYEGVQGCEAEPARAAGLASAAGGRIDAPGDAAEQLKRWRDQGHVAATVHVGRGWEGDGEVDRLIGAVCEAQEAVGLPLCVETHRATITQDTWRTVRMVERHPSLRINADYSHWYTGLEMRYAGVEKVADFLAPTFPRVSFVHGRIGNGGSMQVDAGDDLDHALTLPHVQDFVRLWTRVAAAFRQNAKPGDVLPFAPELLQPDIFYARTFPGPGGEPVEETDRWQQALLLCELMEHAFAAGEEPAAAGM